MHQSSISLASVYSKSEYHLDDIDHINGQTQILNFIRPQNYRRSNNVLIKEKNIKKKKFFLSNLGTTILLTLGLKKNKKDTTKTVKQVKNVQSKAAFSSKTELQKTKLFVDLINFNSDSTESSPASTTSSSSPPPLEPSITASTTRLNQIIGSIMNLSTLQVETNENEKGSSAWNLTYVPSRKDALANDDSDHCDRRRKKQKDDTAKITNVYKSNTSKNKIIFDENKNNDVLQSKSISNVNNIYDKIYKNIYRNMYKSDNNGLHMTNEDDCANEKDIFSVSLNTNLNDYCLHNGANCMVINQNENADRNDSEYTTANNETIAKKKRLKVKLRQQNYQNKLLDDNYNGATNSNTAFIDFGRLKTDNNVSKCDGSHSQANKKLQSSNGFVNTRHTNADTFKVFCGSRRGGKNWKQRETSKSTEFTLPADCHNSASPTGTLYANTSCSDSIHSLLHLAENSRVFVDSTASKYKLSTKRAISHSKEASSNAARKTTEASQQTTKSTVSLRKIPVKTTPSNPCARTGKSSKTPRPFSIGSFYDKRAANLKLDSCFVDSHHDFSPAIFFSRNNQLTESSSYFHDTYRQLDERDNYSSKRNSFCSNVQSNLNATSNSTLHDGSCSDRSSAHKEDFLKKYNLNRYFHANQSTPDCLSQPRSTKHSYRLNEKQKISFKNQLFFL